MHDSLEFVNSTIQAGASGYILKVFKHYADKNNHTYPMIM